jgi:hypothetical protein
MVNMEVMTARIQDLEVVRKMEGQKRFIMNGNGRAANVGMQEWMRRLLLLVQSV